MKMKFALAGISLAAIFTLGACSSDSADSSADATSPSVTESTAEVTAPTVAPTTMASTTTTLPDRTAPETREKLLAAFLDDYYRNLPGVWEAALEICARLDGGWTNAEAEASFISEVEGVQTWDMDAGNVFYTAVENVCPEYWPRFAS